MIQGEVNDDNAAAMGGVAAHAGLFAPAEDLAQFAQAILNGGAPVFRRESLAIFTKRELHPAETTRTLGWDTPSQTSLAGKTFFAWLFRPPRIHRYLVVDRPGAPDFDNLVDEPHLA